MIFHILDAAVFTFVSHVYIFWATHFNLVVLTSFCFDILVYRIDLTGHGLTRRGRVTGYEVGDVLGRGKQRSRSLPQDGI